MSDTPKVPDYAIVKCRGHWHVTYLGEELVTPVLSEKGAQVVADKLNAGWSFYGAVYPFDEYYGVPRNPLICWVGQARPERAPVLAVELSRSSPDNL